MSYFVTEDHCRIYYEDRGPKDAQCIVFVHGGGCNRFFYKKNVPVLAKKFRVLSYDQRCHGDSDKPEYGTYFARMARDLRELLEALDMHKVVLVGHSMGMDVIWQYIKDYGLTNVEQTCICMSGIQVCIWRGNNRRKTSYDRSGRAVSDRERIF